MNRFALALASILALLVPVVALASGGDHGDDHGGFPAFALIMHLVNLLILVGGIFWLARRPVSDALKNRSLHLRRAIDEAQQAREQAGERIEELEEKLSSFEFEVERIRKELADQAERERAAIVERTQREAASIQASAERAIRDEAARARRSLQGDVVGLAVKLAEATIAKQVGDSDHERLARELIAVLDPRDISEEEADYGL